MLFKNHNFSKVMFLTLVTFIAACKNDQKSKGVIKLVSELDGSETDLKAPSSDNVEGGKAILSINKEKIDYQKPDQDIEIVLENVGTGKAIEMRGAIKGSDFVFTGNRSYPGNAGNCTNALNAKEKCSVFVSYKPKDKNKPSVGALEIVYNTIEGSQNLSINLTSNASQNPLLITSPALPVFSNVASYREMLVQIENIGGQDTEIQDIKLSKDAFEEFSIKNNKCVGMKLNQADDAEINSKSCYITLVYQPQPVALPNFFNLSLVSNEITNVSLAQLEIKYTSNNNLRIKELPVSGNKVAELSFVENITQFPVDTSVPQLINPLLKRSFFVKNTGTMKASMIKLPQIIPISGYAGDKSYRIENTDEENPSIPFCGVVDTLMPNEMCKIVVSILKESQDLDRAGILMEYFNGSALYSDLSDQVKVAKLTHNSKVQDLQVAKFLKLDLYPRLVAYPPVLDFKAISLPGDNYQVRLILQNEGKAKTSKIKFTFANQTPSMGEFSIIQDNCNDQTIYETLDLGPTSCSVIIGFDPRPTITTIRGATAPNISKANLLVSYDDALPQQSPLIVPVTATKAAKLDYTVENDTSTLLDISRPFPVVVNIGRKFAVLNRGLAPAIITKNANFIQLFGNSISFVSGTTASSPRLTQRICDANVVLQPGEMCFVYVTASPNGSSNDIVGAELPYYDYAISSVLTNNKLTGLMLSSGELPELEIACANSTTNQCALNNVSRTLGATAIRATFTAKNIGGGSSRFSSQINLNPLDFQGNSGFKNITLLPASTNSCPIKGSVNTQTLVLNEGQSCSFIVEYKGNASVDGPMFSGNIVAPFSVSIYEGTNAETQAIYSYRGTLASNPTLRLVSADANVDCTRGTVNSGYQFKVPFAGTLNSLINLTSMQTVKRRFAVCNSGNVTATGLEFKNIIDGFFRACPPGLAPTGSICSLPVNSPGGSQFTTNGAMILSFPAPIANSVPSCANNISLLPGRSCVFEISYTPSTIPSRSESFKGAFSVGVKHYPGPNLSQTVPEDNFAQIYVTTNLIYRRTALGVVYNGNCMPFQDPNSRTVHTLTTKNLANPIAKLVEICNLGPDASAGLRISSNQCEVDPLLPSRFRCDGFRTVNNPLPAISLVYQLESTPAVSKNFIIDTVVPGRNSCTVGKSLAMNETCFVQVTYLPQPSSLEYNRNYVSPIVISEAADSGSFTSPTSATFHLTARGVFPQVCIFSTPNTSCEPSYEAQFPPGFPRGSIKNSASTMVAANPSSVLTTKRYFIRNIGQAFNARIRINSPTGGFNVLPSANYSIAERRVEIGEFRCGNTNYPIQTAVDGSGTFVQGVVFNESAGECFFTIRNRAGQSNPPEPAKYSFNNYFTAYTVRAEITPTDGPIVDNFWVINWTSSSGYILMDTRNIFFSDYVSSLKDEYKSPGYSNSMTR